MICLGQGGLRSRSASSWLCDWIGSSIPFSQGSLTGKEDYSQDDSSLAHYGKDLFFFSNGVIDACLKTLEQRKLQVMCLLYSRVLARATWCIPSGSLLEWDQVGMTCYVGASRMIFLGSSAEIGGNDISLETGASSCAVAYPSSSCCCVPFLILLCSLQLITDFLDFLFKEWCPHFSSLLTVVDIG